MADDNQPGSEPLVSVCVPTFNRAGYLEEALESALKQTYERLEVVVSDDCSEDSTAALLRRLGRDKRLRVLENPTRLGHVHNRNRVVVACRGDFVKFLDDDDLLEPTCVAEMVARTQQEPGVGFVFCRRRPIAGDGNEEERLRFQETYGALHAGFSELRDVSSGAELFAQWLSTARLKGNWIGEPTTVMLRRELFMRVGGFNPWVHQMLDADLWLRVLPHTRVGFIDTELVSYRVGHDRMTRTNGRDERSWLDALWTLDALWHQLEIPEMFPSLHGLLVAERRQAWRTVAKFGRGAAGRRVPPSAYLPYVAYRLRGSLRGREDGWLDR